MDERFSLLCLLSVPGIGSHRIRRLVSRFGNARAVLDAGYHDLCEVDGITSKIAKSILQKVDKGFADDQLRRVEKLGARLIAYWDPRYPALLKEIFDPPALLFYKGELNLSGEPCMAVVGMRSPSSYGRSVAERLARSLAAYGITVASGMARGIDTSAHNGALKAGGKTVAVLGSGLDVIYPPENHRLFAQIAENGAVVTEFPMTTEPTGAHFPRRNRIISGLSWGTVVIEAGERSGALITAYIALEQGREVFAIPGSILSARSRGPHKLIKEGAKLVESIEDILCEFPDLERHGKANQLVYEPERLLSSEEKAIWTVLSEEPLHIDAISEKTRYSMPEALALLLSMELKSCVKQLSGMRFMRQ